MKRSCSILLLLIICMAISSGQEWLDGGYVGQDDYSEVGQYFNDPLFYPQGTDAYTVYDPAIRNMLISMDIPGESIPRPSDPAIRQMEASLDYPRNYGAYKTSSPVTIWPTRDRYMQEYSPKSGGDRLQIILSDGTVIDLILYQYQDSIYGQGSLNMGRETQWVTARGYMYGSNLLIDITPNNSVTQYAISIDTTRRDMPGRYTLYRYGNEPCWGTVNARWLAT